MSRMQDALTTVRSWPSAVRAILAIGLGGWLFRLWLVLSYRATCDVPSPDCYTVAGDAWYHHAQANLIADGKWFKNGVEYEVTGILTESAGDPPFYPMFLAGFSALGLDSVAWHRTASTLCGLALVILAGLFARRLAGDLLGPRAGDRAGIAAALIAALHPMMWINDMMLLSESSYQPFVVLALWAGYEWTKDPSRRRMAVVGVAIAFAALSRAEAVSLLGFLIVPLVIWRNPLPPRERIVQGALGIVAGLLVLAPWLTYNNLRFENPVTLTSASGAVLMAGACDSAWSGPAMGIWHTCFEERNLGPEMEEELPGSWRHFGDPERVVYDESVRDRFATEKAIEYTLDNIERFPKVAIARIGRSLEFYGVGHTLEVNYQIEGRWKVPSTIGLIVYYLLVPFTLLALWVMRDRGARLIVPLSMWIMVLFASVSTFGLTRYRVPIDVAMVVLAGLAIAWLWERIDERQVRA